VYSYAPNDFTSDISTMMVQLGNRKTVKQRFGLYQCILLHSCTCRSALWTQCNKQSQWIQRKLHRPVVQICTFNQSHIFAITNRLWEV